MRPFILILFFSLVSTFTFSQEANQDLNTLENQFDKIYRTSSTYQAYKVIDKQKYVLLKKNALDSLKKLKSTILEKENLLKTEKENISLIKEQLNKTQLELELANKKENSISLFGMMLNKTTYNLLLWSIIIILLLGLFYFIFKFTRSNVLTKKAKENLFDVEKEYEEHRKKSLEREQKMRRQLQDEINKQRNS
ncbi:hypothetical protein MC378_08010 [Polaribacter sp. MSW13]|uniref:tRNA (Guanine-N1)-methyltransferase n=1 Tax=Polaribacter marinus TaxID=2916838 RepID=A0A9X2AK52_9FLAO|nr:hypothetical protein [Polaribacter marinus]MCI2229108.1 hypothetical protein [Polaribacter marinus]